MINKSNNKNAPHAPKASGGVNPTTMPSAESAEVGENISAVHDFYVREELKRSTSQRFAENIGGFVGRPTFLIVILIFVILWIGANLALHYGGRTMFDESPFVALHGIMGLAGLLTTVVVLIKQNRISRLSEQRDHLDLKVTLLIEQKTAKLIDLMEELRRDLPNVKNRHDSGAAVLQQAMSPDLVLAALDEEVITLDGSGSPQKVTGIFMGATPIAGASDSGG